jgi:hypothetical protein
VFGKWYLAAQNLKKKQADIQIFVEIELKSKAKLIPVAKPSLLKNFPLFTPL